MFNKLLTYLLTYCRRWTGNMFHRRGPAAAKHRSLKLLLERRWVRSELATDFWKTEWRCAYMNFLRQGFWKLSSDWQTDIQTDTTEIIHHAASWVVNNSLITQCADLLLFSTHLLVTDANTLCILSLTICQCHMLVMSNFWYFIYTNRTHHNIILRSWNNYTNYGSICKFDVFNAKCALYIRFGLLQLAGSSLQVPLSAGRTSYHAAITDNRSSSSSSSSRGKIIRTVLCCIVYWSCVQS